MVRCTLIYQNWSIGLCKSRSVRCCLGQRLHRKDDVSPGCHDRRASSSRLYDGHSLVVRSVRLAAAPTAAHDHDEDKDKRAANHSSLTHIRHVIPPDRDTWIKKDVYKLIYKLRVSGETFQNFSLLIYIKPELILVNKKETWTVETGNTKRDFSREIFWVFIRIFCDNCRNSSALIG